MTRRFEGIGEDWLAIIIGLLVFALALGPVLGADLIGWAAAPMFMAAIAALAGWHWAGLSAGLLATGILALLIWQRDLTFEASSGEHTLVLDGDRGAGPSPMQTLAFSIAGCMAMDVVDIVRKGRHAVRAVEAHFSGDRAEEPPRRFVAIRLTFVLHGDVPGQAVERAIALSREKYCSVAAALRDDISFVTSYEVVP